MGMTTIMSDVPSTRRDDDDARIAHAIERAMRRACYAATDDVAGVRHLVDAGYGGNFPPDGDAALASAVCGARPAGDRWRMVARLDAGAICLVCAVTAARWGDYGLQSDLLRALERRPWHLDAAWAALPNALRNLLRRNGFQGEGAAVKTRIRAMADDELLQFRNLGKGHLATLRRWALSDAPREGERDAST